MNSVVICILKKKKIGSDPANDDTVVGYSTSGRGQSVVCFGADKVHDFCRKNKIEVIVRAHQVGPSG